MRPAWHDDLHRVLGWLAAVSGVVGTVYSAALKAPVDEWSKHSEFAGGVVRSMQGLAWIVIPFCIIATGLLLWIRERLRPPWFWAILTYLLDQLHSQAFHDREAGDPEHYHRVTLFQRKRWHFCREGRPWRGWLVPVKRSGDLTHGTRVAFLATKKGEWQGVAGKTWALDQVFTLEGLRQMRPETAARGKETYAKRTGVTVKWMERNWEDAQARSFVGIPVKVGGKRWGVVVLDSRSPQQIPFSASTLYPELVPLLGKLLSRTTNE